MDSPTSVVAGAALTPPSSSTLDDATAADRGVAGRQSRVGPLRGADRRRPRDLSDRERVGVPTRRPRARRRPAAARSRRPGSAPTPPRSRTRSTTSSPAVPDSCPHQDRTAYPGAPDLVSLLVAIDACTEQSGCLWIAPEVDHTLPTDDRGVVERHVTDALDWQMVELAPGDALIIDGYAPHWSGANETDRPRRVLVASYAPTHRATPRPSTTDARAAAMAASTGATAVSASAPTPTSPARRSRPTPRRPRLHPLLTVRAGGQDARKSSTSGARGGPGRRTRARPRRRGARRPGSAPRSPRSSGAARCRRSGRRR